MGAMMRFPAIVLGKACAFNVLMMSLSNQMSALFGISYFSSLSFAICLLGAAALAGLLPLVRRSSIRLAGAILTTVLSVAWIALMVGLQVLAKGGLPSPEMLLISHAFLGRFVTLLINMQWNYQLSLGSLEETPRNVATTMLLSACLLFLSLSLDTTLSQVLLMACLMTSVLLNLIVSYDELTRTGKGISSPADAIAQSDALHPVASESLGITRVLYFGSRAGYGIVLGLLTSLASINASMASADRALTGALCILSAIASTYCAVSLLTRRGSIATVILLPVIAALMVFVAFHSQDGPARLCLYAMLAEIAWTTQNLFQLPSYRRICRLHPAVFSFADYLAQIIPYYLLVWALTSTGASAWPAMTGTTGQLLGLASVAALALVCTAAMIHHAKKYLPEREAQKVEGPSHAAREAALATQAQQLDLLTPRERDVFVLLASGYSRAYIGKVLHIAPDTVKVHARHIYAKLGIGSRDELIKFAAVATPPPDSEPHA